MWKNIESSILWVVIGYLIGSINFAVIFSRTIKHQDIRNLGSGNAGATNVRRNYGNKLGNLTGLFDVLKLIIAMLIGYFVKVYTISFSQIYLGPIGLAVILGHMYPVFSSFRGGKGASCLLGYLIVMQWWLFIFGFGAFFLILKRWKIVSLAALIAPGVWILAIVIFGLIFQFTNIDSNKWNIPIANFESWWLNVIYLLIAYWMVILKHLPNIRRLINKTENKITTIHKHK